MLRIWGRPTSICTQRVLWACAELNLEYDLTLASATMGEQGHISSGHTPYGIVDTTNYKEMNPNSTVPVIKDGDYTLWESNSIVAYLALRYGPAELYRDDIQVFAQASQWMAWTNEHLDSGLHTLVMEKVRLAAELRSPEAIKPAQEKIIRELEVLEQHLQNRPFVCGSQFTMGDISLGAAVYRGHLLGARSPSMSHVEAWQARLRERPAFLEHIAPQKNHLA